MMKMMIVIMISAFSDTENGKSTLSVFSDTSDETEYNFSL
jgi:hypothetical protein